MYSVEKQINLWLNHSGREFNCAVETRLQRPVSGLSWLLSSLHPLAQDFLLSELHPHPPTATTYQPGPPEALQLSQLDAMLPGPLEPPLSRKQRLPHSRMPAFSNIGAVNSGAVFCLANEDNGGFPASPVTVVTKTAFSEPTLSFKDCVQSAPFEPGAQPIPQPLAQPAALYLGQFATQ